MPFEFDGERYAKSSSLQTEWGEKLIAELDLTGSERILDLGCGVGGLSARLSELVPSGQVLGIDASRGMLGVARRNRRDNLRFELLDIDDLSCADEFDVIFSNATLHWVLDHERLMRNVLRALRSGGRARFNFAADGNCVHYFQAVREAMALPAYARFFEAFDWPYYMPAIDDYRAFVGTFGFSECEVWGENADRSFPEEDALAAWIDQPSIVPFLAQVDPRNKRSFRDLVVDRTVRLTRRDDGSCFETFRRVNLLTRK